MTSDMATTGTETGATETGTNNKLVLLSEDKPIQNQKWAVVSMVSPYNPRQKCAVHAFKVKYVSEDQETACAWIASSLPDCGIIRSFGAGHTLFLLSEKKENVTNRTVGT
ncbi:hypothetical protein HK102_013742 [Quaeritorhiza haematococci]|nr:hypothetical protein HK102_013742 [Quaeritorhiza haematococci]